MAVGKPDLLGERPGFGPTSKGAVELAGDDFAFGQFHAVGIPFGPATIRHAFDESFRHLTLTIGVPTLRDAMQDPVGNCGTAAESAIAVAIDEEAGERIALADPVPSSIDEKEVGARELGQGDGDAGRG